MSATDASDVGSQLVQPDIDVFIPPVNLFYVFDHTGPFGRKGGDQEGNTGTDIGRRHPDATQGDLVIQANDGGTMRVTQNDLCSHVNQFVYEKEPAFEHLLMDQYTPFGLCGYHQYDADQVGCEPRPWSIGNGHDRTIHKALHGVMILCRNQEIMLVLNQLDSKSSKNVRNDAQVLVIDMTDRDLRTRHGSQPNETSNFNHIREKRVFTSVE